MKATKVKIRTKALKDGKRAVLRLDYYPPILNPNTGKLIRFQNTGLYVYVGKNLTALERQHNQVTKQQAEQLRSQRQIDIQSSQFDFFNKNQNDCFISFMQSLTTGKAYKTRQIYETVVKHLRAFNNNKPLLFGALSVATIERFLDYLQSLELEVNTVWMYYSKVKAGLKQAYKKDMISTDIATKVKSAPREETDKEYLTLDELRQLFKTPCEHQDLKRACIFSALTGLRISDVLKLKYKDFSTDDNGQLTYTIRVQKTQKMLTNPIGEQAAEIAGSGNPDDKVFPFAYSEKKLKQLTAWVQSAGITKKVTFHTFRHTFATIQLTAGTDITTVSKLLGHSSLSQTMIYAKIVDEAKREAANRIKL
jgi:integrase